MNELSTKFVFDDGDLRKVDALHKKLVSLNDGLNNLGKTSNLGDVIVSETKKGADALGKIGDGVDSLKKKTEDFSPKPTISRWYENEEKSVRTATERIAGLVDNAKASIGNSIPVAPKAPLEFGKPDNALFENVRKSRLEIQKLNSERLDAGKLDGLTKAGARLQSQLQKTELDISRINNALKKTNDKTVIDGLNNDLVKAQNNFDKLYSKQQRYESRPSGSESRKSIGNVSGGSLKLSGFQKQNLAYQINDVATMAAMGANPAQIIASQAGQIAQIFEPAQIAAFTAKYSGLVTVMGAGAAAIALTYKITGDIRAEAERRLKVEERIASAVNNQILSQKESLKNFAELQRQTEFSRMFSASLKTDTREDLINKRANLQQRLNLMPATLPTIENGKVVEKTNEDAERIKAQILEVNAEIVALAQKNTKTANESFTERWEGWKKSQEDAVKAEKRISEEIEKQKKKIVELKSDFRDFSVSSISSLKDNQFVQLYSDLNSAGERMQKRFKDLGDDYVKLATKLEQNNIGKKIAAQIYDSQKTALNFEQDALRVSRIKDTQFDSFQRAIEKVGKMVEFAASDRSLTKQIRESNFYASRYNPNNPQNFDESRFSFAERDRFGETAGNRRRGESIEEFERRRQEAIQIGIRASDALADINNLKTVSLEGTGVYGQEAVAKKILESLPSRDELLKLLESPYVGIREMAQQLLAQQSNSLFDVRAGGRQKLDDFLYEQETSGLNRKFAYEQINLLNQQTGLSDEERAKRYLEITKPLGSDIDPTLRRGIYQADMIAAREERAKQEEAAKQTNRIEGYLKAIVEKITGGIPVDLKDLPAPIVNVPIEIKDSQSSRSTVQRATIGDARRNMDSSYRIGDVHEGGDLRGAIIIN